MQFVPPLTRVSITLTSEVPLAARPLLPPPHPGLFLCIHRACHGIWLNEELFTEPARLIAWKDIDFPSASFHPLFGLPGSSYLGHNLLY